MKLQRDEKQHDAVDKSNRSVFQTVVTFVVPKTRPIHLVLVGLTAGWQADEIKKFLKVITRLLMRFSDI